MGEEPLVKRAELAACPGCGGQLGSHCASLGCPWLACVRRAVCGGFGRPDGTRWTYRPTRAAT